MGSLFLTLHEALMGRGFEKAVEVSPEQAKLELEKLVNDVEKIPGKNPAIPDAHIRSGSFEQYLAHKGITDGNGLERAKVPAKELTPTQPLNYNRIVDGEATSKPVITIYDPERNANLVIDGHTKWGKVRLMDFQYPERAEDLGGHKVDCWILKGNFNQLYGILRDFDAYSKQNVLAKPDYTVDPETEKKKKADIMAAGDDFWGSMSAEPSKEVAPTQAPAQAPLTPSTGPIKKKFSLSKPTLPTTPVAAPVSGPIKKKFSLSKPTLPPKVEGFSFKSWLSRTKGL